MLKLLGYEFRKGLTGLLIMLGATAALEGYFLYGLYINAEDGWHAALAAMLLVFMTLAMTIFVMVRGVTSYSGEMKSRSAYLVFMTPHSTLKIVASKFVFTFVLGLMMAALYGALGLLDIGLLLGRFGELEETIELINEAMTQAGFHLNQYVFAVLLSLLLVMLYALSVCAAAYLAVTISHTLFRDKSWRWLAALVLFWLLMQLVGTLYGLFPSPLEALVYQTAPGLAKITAVYDVQLTPELADLLPALAPHALTSVGVILASIFGCAWMLDKKVSL